MKIQEEIKKIEKRKETCLFHRKTTTCLGTAMEYDQEIEAIDRRIEQLQYRMKR